jgi:hypothetical protein
MIKCNDGTKCIFLSKFKGLICNCDCKVKEQYIELRFKGKSRPEAIRGVSNISLK